MNRRKKQVPWLRVQFCEERETKITVVKTSYWLSFAYLLVCKYCLSLYLNEQQFLLNLYHNLKPGFEPNAVPWVCAWGCYKIKHKPDTNISGRENVEVQNLFTFFRCCQMSSGFTALNQEERIVATMQTPTAQTHPHIDAHKLLVIDSNSLFSYATSLPWTNHWDVDTSHPVYIYCNNLTCLWILKKKILNIQEK